MPKPSPSDGTTTTGRALVAPARPATTRPSKRTASPSASSAASASSSLAQRPVAGDLELERRNLAGAPRANARSSSSCPLIGTRRPTQSSGGPAGGGAGSGPGGDPVVDDLERVPRRSPRSRRDSGRARPRWRCADPPAAPSARSAERERPSLAKRVEAVLRAREHRHARELPGGQPVGSPRARDACAGSPAARAARSEAAARRRAGRRRACSRMPSTGTPASTSRRRTPTRPARPRAGGRSGVPAALAQVRQQRQQMRLRAGDARDLADVQDGRRRCSPARELHDRGRPTSRRSARARPARAARARPREVELPQPADPRRRARPRPPAESAARRGGSPAKTGFDASTGRQVAAAS